MREFYEPGIPVIFTEAASAWQAKGLFTPAWLAERFGERTTEVRGRSYSMCEVVALLDNSTADQPAPYPCIFDIPGELPELLPLLQPLDLA